MDSKHHNGLAYFELADKCTNSIMSATIPNNTALIITLFDAYRRHNNATINIAGPGQKNIKIIIWATYEDPLYFSSNLIDKRISYAGYPKGTVNKVSTNEFGKEADVIYSSFKSPVDIGVLYYGNNYFTRTAKLSILIYCNFTIFDLGRRIFEILNQYVTPNHIAVTQT